MHSSAVRLGDQAPGALSVAALLVDERERDTPGVSVPRAEVHVIARFGRSARRGLDVHVLGVREKVHRKLLHGGQRMVLARLHLGTHEGVLGVSAAAIRVAARPIPLEDLWGGAAAERLVDRLGDARDTPRAAVILERAIAERLTAAPAPRASARLALAAAERLTSGSVRDVAFELGFSERHVRRVFGETVGVSPKTFARLARFRRALRAARTGAHPGWATLATAAGYYDQAHLISEFRAIAGTTPQGLLGELRAAASGGWRGAEA